MIFLANVSREDLVDCGYFFKLYQIKEDDTKP